MNNERNRAKEVTVIHDRERSRNIMTLSFDADITTEQADEIVALAKSMQSIGLTITFPHVERPIKRTPYVAPKSKPHSIIKNDGWGLTKEEESTAKVSEYQAVVVGPRSYSLIEEYCQNEELLHRWLSRENKVYFVVRRDVGTGTVMRSRFYSEEEFFSNYHCNMAVAIDHLSDVSAYAGGTDHIWKIYQADDHNSNN